MRTRFKLRRKTDKKLFAVENNFQNQKCSRIRNCLRFKIVLLSLKTIQDDFLLRMRQRCRKKENIARFTISMYYTLIQEAIE